MTNATDRDTRQIVHHLLGSDGIEPDCLPFPAGPLVPRQQTQAPPLIQHHLKAADRVALAYLLWPEETGGQHRDKAAYTGTLDRLHLLSSRAWYLMHQQNPKPQATAMVEAWFHLLRKDPSRSQQQFDIWRRKVRTVVVNRLRVSRTPATLGKETSEPGASLAVAAASVTRDFLDIFGVSMLLQRFWFKQFHARRRFVWEKSESKASIHPTHDAALKMLQRIESQAGHPLAPTAAALCSPGLVPGKDYPAASWTDQLRSAHCVGRALPDCFCPFLPRVHAHYKASGQLDPAPAAVNLQQAQRIWREIGRSPDELYAVDALAGEVAYSMEGQYTPEKAYAPPAYTCTCHATKVEYKGPLSANCGHVAAAMNYLKHGKWSLLQRFWFKQLHSHHGFLWTHVTAGKPVYLYHRVALGLLHKLRQQPDHPLAAVAAALTRAALMPPRESAAAQAWYEQLRSPTGREKLPLPTWLCPHSLGDVQLSLSQAQLFCGKLSISEDELLAVDTLAREVASLMTDPWVCHQLDWQRSDLSALEKNSDAAIRPDARHSLLARIDPEHEALEVTNRLRAMHSYMAWTHHLWNVLEQSLKTLNHTP